MWINGNGDLYTKGNWYNMLSPTSLEFKNATDQTVMEMDDDGNISTTGTLQGANNITYYLTGAGGSILACYNGSGGKEVEYLYGQGMVGHVDNTNKEYYYLKDHLSSTRVVVSEKEVSQGVYGLEVLKAIDYYPYGKQINLLTEADVKTRPTFTGKEFDTEGNDSYNLYGIGEYYFGARYYDPEVGIWLTADKKGQFFNPYAYGSNPVIMVDKDGNFFFLIPILVGAAIGAINAEAHGEDVFVGALVGAGIGLISGGIGSFAGSFVATQTASLIGQSAANIAGASIGGFLSGGVQGGLYQAWEQRDIGAFTFDWRSGLISGGLAGVTQGAFELKGVKGFTSDLSKTTVELGETKNTFLTKVVQTVGNNIETLAPMQASILIGTTIGERRQNLLIGLNKFLPKEWQSYTENMYEGTTGQKWSDIRLKSAFNYTGEETVGEARVRSNQRRAELGPLAIIYGY
jgi:RHS repeat-associated protein